MSGIRTGEACSVSGCGNYKPDTDANNLGIKFFQFPKNQAICTLWIQSCVQEQKTIYSTSTVCSIHFATDDYITKDQALPIVQRRLKETAVPSLKLPRPVLKYNNNLPQPVSILICQQLGQTQKKKRPPAITKKNIDPRDDILDALINSVSSKEEEIEELKNQLRNLEYLENNLKKIKKSIS